MIVVPGRAIVGLGQNRKGAQRCSKESHNENSVHLLILGHRMAVVGGVGTSDIVFKLPLNIAQQR